MKREVVVSVEVADKLADVVAYLKNELKFSEQAAMNYRGRFIVFLRSFETNFDHPLCRYRQWRELGYRCATFRGWVLAYETVPEGIVFRDMKHGKLLADTVD